MVDAAEHGQEVEVFMDRTPFYGESGGQIGDTGSITHGDGRGSRCTMCSTRCRASTVIAARSCQARSRPARTSISRSTRRDGPGSANPTREPTWCTATLREVVGDHAHQAGSLVEPGRLRFDFSHFQGMTPEELAELERVSNQRLIANADVSTTVTSQDEAKAMGALAFFGDKYGDTVRVVKVGEYSVEFCGGTHTHTAGEVGPLLILSEASIGSNIRRIEALTGEAAYEHLVKVRDALDGTGRLLRTPPTEVPARVEALLAKVEELETEIEGIRSQRRSALAAELAGAAATVGEASMVVDSVGELAPEQLRQLATSVRDRLKRGVVVLGATNSGKGALVAAVSHATWSTPVCRPPNSSPTPPVRWAVVAHEIRNSPRPVGREAIS